MFTNEPLTDFSVSQNRDALVEALREFDSRLASGPIQVAPIIDGRPVHSGETFVRVDPSETKTSLVSVLLAAPQVADGALDSARRGADSWRNTPAETRIRVLQATAQLMRQRRHKLSAAIIREAGKPWREADADVAEAIDFCEYYAEQMAVLCRPRKTQEVPGEDNYSIYQPRGVAVVISPWNFPLAIACGMTTAALVTGNSVIFKPSGQTCLVGYELAHLLYEAGVPAQALVFLPGRGDLLGRRLVENKDVALICFTGSKAVGLDIIQRAAVIQSGQSKIKRVVAELGGKNAIIVDQDADLDEAIRGSLVSAFGYSGQKCSACSRLIVVGDAYERFLERFCAAARDLKVGPARDPASFMGPVIDAASKARIDSLVARMSKECKLAFQGNCPDGGYYVPISIFRDVPPSSPLWREEIFGPVVACCQARDFETALGLANDCEYALTGGIFSRNPEHIERCKRDFAVGNLYINRQCTGALVCRQPFGGFKMSGIGSKAGGPDYLLQFVEPRTITENTVRRGFVPVSQA